MENKKEMTIPNVSAATETKVSDGGRTVESGRVATVIE